MAEEPVTPNPNDVPEENRFVLVVYADGFVTSGDAEESET